MAAERFRVTGRVQGVGFRWSTRRRAERLGLHGTVRNLPDGDVEAVARGTDDALGAFEAWLREGPPGARVDGLTVEPIAEADVPDSGFTIGR